MINSKNKGAAGEREAVRLCRSEGFDCHRTAQARARARKAAE